MFDFTLEWASRRSVAERAINARAMTAQVGLREAFVLPLVLLITFLLALSIVTGTHLHKHADRALLSAALGGVSVGMGLPMLYPASESCRRPSNLGSVPRLRQADVLALLTAD